MLLDAERQPIPDVPAIYFVQPSEAAVARIVQDVARGLYDTFHLNFSTHIPRPLMEKLAAGTGVAEGRPQLLSVVMLPSRCASALQLRQPGHQPCRWLYLACLQVWWPPMALPALRVSMTSMTSF